MAQRPPRPCASARQLAQPSIEIYFSVIQRKVLTPNDFAGLAEVEQRLLAFERLYEGAAKPFEWKFTRHDFAVLMKRLAEKDDLRPAA